MIPRAKALKILRDHCLQPETNTAWYPVSGKDAEGTSFDAEMGVKEEYRLADVMAWLGY